MMLIEKRMPYFVAMMKNIRGKIWAVDHTFRCAKILDDTFPASALFTAFCNSTGQVCLDW
jgi:hypothetical protein